MTTPDESPIIRTSSKRMAQGLAIVVIVMAVGAAIAIPNWHNMAKNPPPVSTITTKPSTEGGAATSAGGGGAGSAAGGSKQGGTVAGATTISILQGASVQGNPAFDPNDAKVSLDSKVVWQNKDTVPHTATSGTGPSDPNSGKIFDTKIINNGETSSPQQLKGAKVGDSIPYYCQIHPYMTAKLTVTAAKASSSNATGGAATTPTAGGPVGASLTIMQGAATQGNPAYDPATLTVKKGDNIQVSNKDNVPHTVTNGKGPDDPNSGKLFDTSIINGGESAKVPTTKLTAGEYPYHCTIHPYMTGTLKVQ